MRKWLAGLLYRIAWWLAPYAMADHDLVTDPTFIRAEHRDAFVIRGFNRWNRTAVRIYVPADYDTADMLARAGLVMVSIISDAHRRRREREAVS